MSATGQRALTRPDPSASPIPSMTTDKYEFWFYLPPILIGALLFVLAAINQPYSYDELTQIRPYGSGDIDKILGATRQPPLTPLLEAGIEVVFGTGQFQQRLVPVLSGIGSLIVMAALLRRLGAGRWGALALLWMATAPLMVRYAAYTRPYAFPAFVMLLTAYASHRWLQDHSRKWLVVAGAATATLPMIRVPEPLTFVAVSLLVVAFLAGRGHISWRRARPLFFTQFIALGTIGVASYVLLERSSGSVADLSPESLQSKLGVGTKELVTHFPKVLADALPWWPLTVALVLFALLWPRSRQLLLDWVWFWPLLAGPIAFAIAYHYATTLEFSALPYRDRFASFFLAPMTLLLAALLTAVSGVTAASRRKLTRAGIAAAIVVAIVLEAPRTAAVVTKDAAPDFEKMSKVLTTQLPEDAIVLYDRTTPAGASRQPFLGTYRYMGAQPRTLDVRDIAEDIAKIPNTGKVYLLFNGQCAYAGRCVPGKQNQVRVKIPGWRISYQHDRFTLYEPTGGQSGRAGVTAALLGSGRALGNNLGYVQLYAAAAMLRFEGKTAAADQIIADVKTATSPAQQDKRQTTIDLYDLE